MLRPQTVTTGCGCGQTDPDVATEAAPVSEEASWPAEGVRRRRPPTRPRPPLAPSSSGLAASRNVGTENHR